MSPEQARAVMQLVDRLGVPVCALLFLALLVWRLMPQIRDLLVASAEERRGRVRAQGEYSEVIRHNSAVIENNTAALRAVIQSREQEGRLISAHEDMSRERMQRIQATCDEVAATADKLVTDMQVVKERH